MNLLAKVGRILRAAPPAVTPNTTRENRVRAGRVGHCEMGAATLCHFRVIMNGCANYSQKGAFSLRNANVLKGLCPFLTENRGTLHEATRPLGVTPA